MSSSMLKKVKFDDKGSFVWTFDRKVHTISFYIEKKNEYLGENSKWEQCKVFFDIVPIYLGRDIVGDVQIDINPSIINIIVCSKTTESFRFVLLADNIEIGICTLSTRKFKRPLVKDSLYTHLEGGKVRSNQNETVSYGDLFQK